MKKYLSALLCMIMLLSSCGSKEPDYKTTIYPSDLLTSDVLAPYIGYTPVMSEEKSRRVSTAIFVSEPLGKEDSVTVKVFQKNQLQSAQKVREYFDECKNTRSDAFVIDSLGVEAFIAYPSIHYYIDGYHVQISAGSGDDNVQKSLLMNLARISYEKFSELTGITADTVSENTDENISEEENNKDE